MQIKIEIDVKPEELRRFIGMPDVAGLQDDIIGFLRDKVGAAGEFDATQFVKQNLDTLLGSTAWKNIAAKIRIGGETAQPAPAKPASRKRGGPKFG